MQKTHGAVLDSGFPLIPYTKVWFDFDPGNGGLASLVGYFLVDPDDAAIRVSAIYTLVIFDRRSWPIQIARIDIGAGGERLAHFVHA